MKQRTKLSLQGLLIISIIPSLLGIILLLAWITYNDLYHTIMSGFEKKLIAVSSITANSIDGETHSALQNLIQYRGCAYDSKNDILYFNNYSNDQLLKINPSNGYVSRVNAPGSCSWSDFTYNSTTHSILAVNNGDVAQLLSMNLQNNTVTELWQFDEPINSIEYFPADNSIFVVGTKLMKLTLSDMKLSVIHEKISIPFMGLAFNSINNQIIGVDTHTNTIYKIDPNTGELFVLGKLTAGGDYFKLGVFGLCFDSKRNKFYGCSTIPIVELNSSLLVTAINYNDSYNIALQHKYLSYAFNMINIRERCNTTFLFTSVLDPSGEHLVYIIDSTHDEIHSYNGALDINNVEEGIRDIWFKGIGRYLSPIKPWEEWGLLKSAYSPIINTQGKVTGFTGTDVNIIEIKGKTNSALILVILLGTITLFIAILIAVFIAHKLTRPLEDLTDMSLQIASGNYGAEMKVINPVEIRELTICLNKLSADLKKSDEEITSSITNFENGRIEDQKMSLLDQRAVALTDYKVNIFIGLINTPRQIAGGISYNNFRILYTSRDKFEGFDTSRKRYEISSQLFLLSKKYIDDIDMMFKILQNDISNLYIVDTNKNNISYYTDNVSQLLNLADNNELANFSYPAGVNIIENINGRIILTTNPDLSIQYKNSSGILEFNEFVSQYIKNNSADVVMVNI